MTTECTYTRTDHDGWGDDWKTQCGHALRIDAPDDVGFASAPKPNENGSKFCTWCGGEITLKEKK